MKLTFTLLILFATLSVLAQNAPKLTATPAVVPHTAHKSKPAVAAKDTVIDSDTTKENKEPQYWYLSINTDVFVNSKGGFAKRFSPAVEFGRTYGIFDLGIATGMTNTLAGDTTHYIELRPTINIFSKGRFAEALCLGGGYVLGAQQGFMTEICNSINFNISETVAIAVTQGYYYFDGTNSARNTQYMGFAFTYNFLRKHSTNIRRKRAALVSDN